MKSGGLVGSVLLVGFCLMSCAENSGDVGPDNPTFPKEQRAALADCLTERGWAMYASNTCTVCRAQRQAFGTAFSLITEIECNPHAPGSRSKLCVEKSILKFPTWILEMDGQESKRLEGFQSLDDLASLSECRTVDGNQPGVDSAK